MFCHAKAYAAAEYRRAAALSGEEKDDEKQCKKQALNDHEGMRATHTHHHA